MPETGDREGVFAQDLMKGGGELCRHLGKNILGPGNGCAKALWAAGFSLTTGLTVSGMLA